MDRDDRVLDADHELALGAQALGQADDLGVDAGDADVGADRDAAGAPVGAHALEAVALPDGDAALDAAQDGVAEGVEVGGRRGQLGEADRVLDVGGLEVEADAGDRHPALQLDEHAAQLAAARDGRPPPVTGAP